MKIKEIIWLVDIVEKLERKHCVNQKEVIDVLENKPKFRFVEKGYRKGEDIYAALGQTYEGRYLIVFFVYKKNGQALIISARDMTRSERR
ncbi:MAG: BrnT family toxin, partial [Nitrospirae bacterium]